MLRVMIPQLSEFQKLCSNMKAIHGTQEFYKRAVWWSRKNIQGMVISSLHSVVKKEFLNFEMQIDKISFQKSHENTPLGNIFNPCQSFRIFYYKSL